MTPEVQELIVKARRSLDAARALQDRGDSDFAVSRAYYAMLYMAQAALLLHGKVFTRHSAVISAFGRELVKPGLLGPQLHESLRRGFDERNIGDYTVADPYPRERADDLIESATEFVTTVEEFLKHKPRRTNSNDQALVED